MSKTKDDELTTMRRFAKVLDGMDQSAADRVLAYLQNRVLHRPLQGVQSAKTQADLFGEP